MSGTGIKVTVEAPTLGIKAVVEQAHGNDWELTLYRNEVVTTGPSTVGP